MASNKKRFNSRLVNFSGRTLYARLMLLLFSISISVILMQASTVFLLDYIPSSQSAIDTINAQRLYWHEQLTRIDTMKLEDTEATVAEMQKHFLDISDPKIIWLLQKDDSDVAKAINQVEREQNNFSQLATLSMRAASQQRVAWRVARSYDALEKAIRLDSETKRSITSLLQAITLIFSFSCILALVVGARHLLVERLDKLLMFLQSKIGETGTRRVADEFALLEHRVAELSGQMESFHSEVAWARRTVEHTRGLIRAQDFILQFLESVSDDVLSERNMLKMLYSLERTMHFTNTALIYTDDAAVVASERIIFSHHKPPTLTDDMFNELMTTGVLSYDYINNDREDVACLVMTFHGSSNGIGMLFVEMEKERFLEDPEVKVLEITSRLLGMVAKFQSHDEEGRRLAVLEERAAIARELHDSLAQSLSFMKIQVSRLQSQIKEDKANTVLQELRSGLDNAYRELRELLTTFRVHMDLRGLGHAIQATIDEFSQRSPLSITLDNRLVNCRLTVNEEFHILHVVREALSNIVRHSGAKNVAILMLLKNNGEVELTIDDDGVGFSPAESPHDHHGQAIMKERAQTLGGDVDVMAKRYGGTRVRLSFMPKLAQ